MNKKKLKLVGKEKGCLHPERPKTKRCYRCGNELCYECVIEYALKQRVVAASSVDMVRETEYGFFCPYCFIEGVNNKTIKKIKPVFIVIDSIYVVFSVIFLFIVPETMIVSVAVISVLVFLFLIVVTGAEYYRINKKLRKARQILGI